MIRIASMALAMMSLTVGAAEQTHRQKAANVILMRAYEIEPIRKETPLRYENVSDEEVGEIVRAAAEMFPRAIINISGVTTGCPCEEGSQCSDQVWIVAYEPKKSWGLMLSKVNDHWTIGRVQRWWLRYEHLQSQRSSYRSYSAFREAELALIESFPVCTSSAS